MKKFLAALLFTCLIAAADAQVAPPPACGPVPSENQLRWQEMEYYAFLHFSINTYTDQAWGYGDEDINLFNPTKLDCRQWARICKEAGMKGIIITAKHHSGFCLWPSQYTDFSVKNAPWKNGRGDIVRELADACKEQGLRLGVYLSPWDRNHADYGRPEYIVYFRNQLHELLTNYGEIFEVWFDGANGGSGYYGGERRHRRIDAKTYYDWTETYRLVRELQPRVVIWNDGGDRADLRWIGNEHGSAGETNWSLLNADGDVPRNQLNQGVEDGNAWVPGEADTSIRPEWFYHPAENDKVKPLAKLMELYYHSVGRNATLLLNLPIAPDGLIPAEDERAVLEFAQARREAFAVDLARGADIAASNTRGNSKDYAAARAIDGDPNTYWAADDDVTAATLTLNFGKPVKFNRFLAQEYIRLGQRVKAFSVEAMVRGQWKEVSKGTTIGYKRILCFPTVEASQLRLTVSDAKACPLIATVSVYNAPPLPAPLTVTREPAARQNWKLQGAELTLDLGTERQVRGFKYLPPQNGAGDGVITQYEFHISTDNAVWRRVSVGEFSNIQNNPILQTKTFAPTPARYVKLRALKTVNNSAAVCAEFEVMAK